MGIVSLDMKEILSAPLKKSATAMVRVADQYLPIKTLGSEQTKGLLRVIMYLEDMGPTSPSDSPSAVVEQPALGGATADY